MAFEITPNVQVRRDDRGRIRQLSHAQQPYQPESVDLAMESLAVAAAPLTPRALAEQYIRDVAEIYGLESESTENFAAAPTPAPSQAGTELRFKEEKRAGGGTSVSYDQTRFGLPIWDAGMTVRINTAPMQVTSSHNAVHYEIEVHQPGADASYMPQRLDGAALKGLLGLAEDSEKPRVNATRLLIYRYRPEERLDPQMRPDNEENLESFGFAGAQSPDLPSLPLPPVPDEIMPERHYIVSEALFTLYAADWGVLNWRAFIEPQTGAVLYLRPLVSCARGSVFLTDPVTASGNEHTAATDPNVLNPLRAPVALLGLGSQLNPHGDLELSGEFVKLVDVDPPGSAMPMQGPPFDFIYSCPTDDFAACSAYYHCDAVYRMIEGMGLPANEYFNNTDFPVPVDPHALSGGVNAQARGNTMGNGMGAFVFGRAQPGQTMGIAADVRVVLHEFGHALLWDHVSSPNFGFAHSAGDSLAAILHDPGSRAVDRFETFPFMRASAGLSRRHDRKVEDGWAWFGPQYNKQYQGEQILSTTLFRIYQAAGGDSDNLETKKFAARYMAYLIIKSCGLLTFTTPDPDVYVSALIDADGTTVSFQGHPGGAFRKVIRWSFEKQGLYQPPGAHLPVMQEGAPPEVDVYIDDGRRGQYMPFLADFEGQPEIWNRLADDGGMNHESPSIGVVNFAYVKVRNRGTEPATGVVVRAFQSKIPGAAVWPTDWKAATTPRLSVPAAILPGSETVVGPFRWIPQLEDEKLLISVSATGDLSNLETVVAGPILNSRLVPLDNNLAQRAF